METIALLNMKGGVGKTTLAVNLAWYLAKEKKKRVLLVDLDPQFNASQYLMRYDEWAEHRKKKGTIVNVLADVKLRKMSSKADNVSDDFSSVFVKIEKDKSGNSSLYLLPSELELSIVVKNPQSVEFRLYKLLRKIEKNFDYCLIDCAPTDSVLTATALMAANFTLVPMKPDRFSILGYEMMQRVVQTFKEDYPNPSEVHDLGVVFTMVDKNNPPVQQKCMKEIKTIAAATQFFKTEIHYSDSYNRAIDEQTPIFETMHARKLVKEEIAELEKEIVERIAHLKNPQQGRK